MIYCNLKGGLGNMLFQIAATIQFSKKLGVEYSFPNLLTHKRNFDGKSVIPSYGGFFKNLKNDKPKKNANLISFPFHYVEMEVEDESIIDGFFQSEKYFKNAREEILNIFPKYHNFTDRVSVHVRRGDYIGKQKFHNVLPIEYYKKAFTFFKGKKFLFFSDDIEWCKKTFVGQEFEFHKTRGDMADIAIMSSCEHNIVANSSFSWWGAWLNQNDNKKVISPSQWVGPALCHLDTKDIHCEEWIKI